MWPRSEACYLLASCGYVPLQSILKKVGAKRLVVSDSTWSSDQWQFAGVEEFPNIEAVQEYMAAVNELGVFRYVESTSVLGTRLELGYAVERNVIVNFQVAVDLGALTATYMP